MLAFKLVVDVIMVGDGVPQKTFISSTYIEFVLDVHLKLTLV